MAVGGETVHVLVERLPDHHRGARKHKRRFLNGGHRRAPSSCGNSEGTVAICDGLWNRRLLHRPHPPALALCLIMATSPSSDPVPPIFCTSSFFPPPSAAARSEEH